MQPEYKFEYKIVKGSEEEVEAKVQKLLDKGYQLAGALVTTGTGIVAQCMVAQRIVPADESRIVTIN